MTSLLLIPAACCFTFGIGVKNTKQGKAIFAAMFILLVIFAGIIAVNEHAAPRSWPMAERSISR